MAVPRPAVALRAIDARARREHAFLEPADQCFFLFEYAAGAQWRTNRLIAALKCAPAAARADAGLARRKRCAVALSAAALRGSVPRVWVEAFTWSPVPPSRAVGDPGFDDRLQQVLARAFAGYDADIRTLLRLCHSVPADHAATTRLSLQALGAALAPDPAGQTGGPLRRGIVLFDDVLTSGKHFRCCAAALRTSYPGVPVAGVFLARRVRADCRHGVEEPRWLD